MTDRIVSRRAVLTGSAAALAAPAVLSALPRAAVAKAPMLGAARPTFQRFTLGGFEITTLQDGFIQIPGPHPIFGQDQEAGPVQDLMEANFLPREKMEIQFNPIIVNTGEAVVMFDAGNGALRRGKGAGLARARLEEAGYTPEQIDVVVVTHAHPDHIGGLMEDGSPAFPNARYAMGAAEYDFWSPEELVGGKLDRVASLVQSNVVPLAEKMTMTKPGDSVVSGIEAVDAFGHTPGHMAYHIESDGRRLLLFADATNHYVASLQKPDWHVKFDMDKQKAGETRKRILGMLAADRIPATGYHMPFPSVGYVEATGAGFRWEAETYQLDL